MDMILWGAWRALRHMVFELRDMGVWLAAYIGRLTFYFVIPALLFAAVVSVIALLAAGLA